MFLWLVVNGGGLPCLAMRFCRFLAVRCGGGWRKGGLGGSRYVQQLRKVVNEKIGVRVLHVGGFAIAVGHSACCHAGVFAHQYVVRGVAYHDGVIGAEGQCRQNLVYRLWGWFCVFHVVGAYYGGEQVGYAKVGNELVQ